jgi:hypothetical protein
MTVSAGSWANSPTQYRYQWQLVAINGDPIANQPVITHTTSSSTDSYTPSSPTNKTYAVTITASNAYGFSTTSYTPSYEFYVDVSLPMGGSVSLTGSGASGTSITATTTGWSGSPTTYNVAIWAGINMGNYTVFKTSNSPTSSNSVSYTITTGDASPPPYIFIAYATATNIYGTSQQVSSNTITSYIPAPYYAPTYTPYYAPYFAPPTYTPYYAPPTYTPTYTPYYAPPADLYRCSRSQLVGGFCCPSGFGGSNDCWSGGAGASCSSATC